MKLEEITSQFSRSTSSASISYHRTTTTSSPCNTNNHPHLLLLPPPPAANNHNQNAHYSDDKSLVLRHSPQHKTLTRLSHATRSLLSFLLRSLSTAIPTRPFSLIPYTTTTTTYPPLGRKITGTLFGNRKGPVTFAVQHTSSSSSASSEPSLLIELAISTAALVKEMSSGLVRIALECQKKIAATSAPLRPALKLLAEPVWNMYCNGRKCGHASARAVTESDRHVLDTIRSVSVGAGVIPMDDSAGKKAVDGEMLYMRARFERVVGSRDSEAFYMLNPDGNGGPDLSIFLLRL